MKKKIFISATIIAVIIVVSCSLFLENVSEVNSAGVCTNCISLTITETSNITRTKEPVTSGVPLDLSPI